MQGFWLLVGAYKQINNAKQTRTQIELNHAHTHLMSLMSFLILSLCYKTHLGFTYNGPHYSHVCHIEGYFTRIA